MLRRLSLSVLRATALVLVLLTITLPSVMAFTNAQAAAETSVGHHADHHGPIGQHHHSGHGDCCDLCMVACTRCTVMTGALVSVKLGDTVRPAPATPARSIPITWSPRPRLPLSIGPPLLRV